MSLPKEVAELAQFASQFENERPTTAGIQALSLLHWLNILRENKALPLTEEQVQKNEAKARAKRWRRS